jgi:hypothetical protein
MEIVSGKSLPEFSAVIVFHNPDFIGFPWHPV